MSAESTGTTVVLPDSARRAMLTMQLRRFTAEADAAEAREREVDIDAAASELRQRLDSLVEGRRVGHAEKLALARVDAEEGIRQARSLAGVLLDRVPADRAAAYAASLARHDGPLVPGHSGVDFDPVPDAGSAPVGGADEVNDTPETAMGALDEVGVADDLEVGVAANDVGEADDIGALDREVVWGRIVDTTAPFEAHSLALRDVETDREVDPGTPTCDTSSSAEVGAEPVETVDDRTADEIALGIDGGVIEIGLDPDCEVGATESAPEPEPEPEPGPGPGAPVIAAGGETDGASAGLADVLVSHRAVRIDARDDDASRVASAAEHPSVARPQLSLVGAASEGRPQPRSFVDEPDEPSPDEHTAQSLADDNSRPAAARVSEPSAWSSAGASESPTVSPSLDAETLMAVVRELTRNSSRSSHELAPPITPVQPAPIDPAVLAAAVAAAIAPLIEARGPSQVSTLVPAPVGYAPTVPAPAVRSVSSTARHLDVALSSLALMAVLVVLAAWIL